MSKPNPPRVLLAESDGDVRRALVLLLQTALGVVVVAEAADLTGLGAPDAKQADILLIDWAGVAATAPQVFAGLHALNSHLGVIVLSTRPEDAPAALRAGADAFISKVDAPARVLAIIRGVLEAQGDTRWSR